MTYLELVNKVLTRLRENIIDISQFNSDPYYRVIAALVNDAKDTVEEAWQWSGLRGTDTFRLIQTDPQSSGPTIALPNSIDTSYILHNIAVYPNATDVAAYTGVRSWLRQTDAFRMRNFYADPTAVQTNRPGQFAVMGRAQTTGATPYDAAQSRQILCQLWPLPTDGEYWVEIDRVVKQTDFTAADDELLVPSLPVYSLATALASRERGEVGGTPTSELFMMAEKNLSDAIAIDSALFSNEMVWVGGDDRPSRTNVRNW
jgi:hypothetical protein